MKTNDPLWDIIVAEARQASQEEPVLAEFFRDSILDHPDLESALGFTLAQLIASPAMAADHAVPDHAVTTAAVSSQSVIRFS